MKRIANILQYMRRNRSMKWFYFSSTASSGICLVLGICSGIVCARLLGPTGRGELALFQYFPAIIGMVSSLGFINAMGFLTHSRKSEALELIPAGIQLAFLFTGLCILVVSLFAPAILDSENESLVVPSLVLVAFSVPVGLNPTLFSILRNRLHVNWINTALLVQAVWTLMVPVALYRFGMLSAMTIAFGGLAVHWLIFFLNLLILRPRGVLVRQSPEAYCRCIRTLGAFAAPAVAMVLLGLADRFLLARTTSLDEIGYYMVAYAFAYSVSPTVEAFSQLGFVETAIAGPASSYEILISRLQLAQVVLIPTVASLLLCAPFAIPFCFGSEYVPAVWPAVFLVPAVAVGSCAKITNRLLQGRKEVRIGTLTDCVGLVVLSVCALAWCPSQGAFGFAVAFLAASTVRMGILIVYLTRIAEIPLTELWGLRRSVLQRIWSTLGARRIPLSAGMIGARS